MLKERIQEVFEFTKSESPYSKANKGWINQDIFLDLSPSSDTYRQKNEAAKVTLLWSPINSLISNIFVIIIVGSMLVFASVSFVKGRFDFNLFDKSSTIDSVKVQENTTQNLSLRKDIDSSNSTIQQNIDKKDLDKPNEIKSFDEDLMESEKKNISKNIDSSEILIKENKVKEDIQILKNKKSKSNFI